MQQRPPTPLSPQPPPSPSELSSQLQHLRKQYETRIAKLQTDFIQKQIDSQRNHSRQLSKYIKKLQESGSGGGSGSGSADITITHNRSIDLPNKSMKTTFSRDTTIQQSTVRPYNNRQAILRQATLVNDMVGDFQRKLERCVGEAVEIGNARENSGRIKSTRKHIYGAKVEYLEE